MCLLYTPPPPKLVRTTATPTSLFSLLLLSHSSATDENPFSSQVGGGGGGGGGGAPIPNAQPASQQSSFGGVAPVAAAPGASLTFTPNQWRLATGTPGWWILFCVLDIIVSVGLLADGLLMEAQVFGDSAVDTTNVVYLQTIFLGFYFFLFGAASLLCSIIWFTCLGKFVGFLCVHSICVWCCACVRGVLWFWGVVCVRMTGCGHGVAHTRGVSRACSRKQLLPCGVALHCVNERLDMWR